MKKISELISKPIISLYNGKIEGYLNNVIFNKELTKIMLLHFFDDDSQEEKIVDIKEVYSFGSDAITIRCNDNIVLNDTMIKTGSNPINYSVYYPNGNCLGKISDIMVDDKNCITNLILADGTTLPPEKIIKIGENITILQDEEKKVKISNFKSRVKIYTNKINEKITVYIQKTPDQTNETTPLVKISPLPQKIVSNNFGFLIGRKVEKNIYSDNKQIIIKKQNKITRQVIDMACKYGKLKELTTNSII